MLCDNVCSKKETIENIWNSGSLVQNALKLAIQNTNDLIQVFSSRHYYH